MTLYLIAHKVRGEAAFDVAEKTEIGNEEGWIIPTSGHRAYPYWAQELCNVRFGLNYGQMPDILQQPITDLPEHYEVSAAPKGKGKAISGLLEKLGLVKPLEPAQSFKRREW